MQRYPAAAPKAPAFISCAGETAGQSREHEHQHRARHIAQNAEDGQQQAVVAEFKIQVCHRKAAAHQCLRHGKNQKNNGAPDKLIVAGNGGKGLPDADLFGGRFVPRRRLAHHKQRDELCSRKRSAYNKDNGTVRGDGVAADHKAARRKRGYNDAAQKLPHARKQHRAGGKTVAVVGAARQRRHHAPVGDVVHCKYDAVREVQQAEGRHISPALKRGGKRGDEHDDAQHAANGDPWLEFAPARTRGLHHVAHDRVVESVEYARRHHDDADAGKLHRRKRFGEQHIGEQIVGKHASGHIPAHGAHGIRPEVAARKPARRFFLCAHCCIPPFPPRKTARGKQMIPVPIIAKNGNARNEELCPPPQVFPCIFCEYKPAPGRGSILRGRGLVSLF